MTHHGKMREGEVSNPVLFNTAKTQDHSWSLFCTSQRSLGVCIPLLQQESSG